MRLPFVSAALTRANQFLHPRVTNEISVLKPFDNPSVGVVEDLNEQELENIFDIFDQVRNQFLAGHNIVAIDVGKMHIEDFAFCQYTLGSNLTSYFNKDEALQRLSREAGRSITYAEGVKIQGENNPRFMTIAEEYGDVKNLDGFYIMLYDARRVNRFAA